MDQSNSLGGTYDFQKRQDKSQELMRLQKQAGLAIQAEMAMWKMAGLTDGMSVLDVGCGPGIISCSLADILPNGKITGLDLSEELLSQASVNQKQLELQNLSFVQGSIYNPPFEGETFDFVYARFVFQHLQNPAKALENLFRVLKPGGRICLMDVDDRFFVLSPEPKGFKKFHESATLRQAQSGGNREIGREFYQLLCQAGFSQPQTHIHVIRSQDCGMRSFLDVTTRFKANQFSAESNLFSPKERDDLFRDLKNLEQDANAWGAMGVFVGMATKE